jgi:hypothetical protein
MKDYYIWIIAGVVFVGLIMYFNRQDTQSTQASQGNKYGGYVSNYDADDCTGKNTCGPYDCNSGDDTCHCIYDCSGQKFSWDCSSGMPSSHPMCPPP